MIACLSVLTTAGYALVAFVFLFGVLMLACLYRAITADARQAKREADAAGAVDRAFAAALAKRG